MAQIINTNIPSLTAQRNLNSSQSSMHTSLQRLSSGLRINSARDDAAGLAISERFTTQIRGINQAVRNANDGISLAQTAEGAMAEIGNNLQRIRELAVQSRNATNSESDRLALDAEVQQLKAEIGRVAEQTAFNGVKLLDGTFSAQLFQVGANQGETIEISSIQSARVDGLGEWNSVADPAVVTGVAPTGTVTGGTDVPGTASIDVSAFASDAADDGFASFTMDVDGIEVTVAAVTGTSDIAAARASLATNIATAIGAAATANGTTVELSNTTADAVVIDNSSAHNIDVTVAAQTTVGGSTDFAALDDTDTFTVNGEEIAVGATTSAAARLSDLAAAINANTELQEQGISASVVDGALQLTSSGEAITIGGTADLAAETGLTAGVTNVVSPSEEMTGFADLNVANVNGADNAMLAMDAALTAVNTARAEMGAVQNRFSSVIANLSTTSENLSASRSRIMDADFAAETAALTRSQILQQAGTAMLAQANQLPQNVLSLLR